jgi:hypothetical protein
MLPQPICSNTKAEETIGSACDPSFNPVHPTKRSLDKILRNTNRVAYTNAEKLKLHAFCNSVKKLGYDIQIAPCSSTTTHDQILNDGIVILNSKNLGYKCVAINCSNGENIFGRKKRAVSLYLSPINGDKDFDEYCHISDEKSLLKALLLFQKLYREAEALHLP